MNNLTIAYTEMKVKTLITDIENKSDKNQQDYWVIRTKAGNYLAFSTDFSLSSKTRSLLTNYPHQLVNRVCLLTIKKRESLDKVIEIDSS